MSRTGFDQRQEFPNRRRRKFESCQVERQVWRLDVTQIEYRVTGEVDFELQCGSDSDVDDSYPYKAKAVAAVGKPLDIDTQAIRLTADTSSFYE